MKGLSENSKKINYGEPSQQNDKKIQIKRASTGVNYFLN